MQWQKKRSAEDVSVAGVLYNPQFYTILAFLFLGLITSKSYLDGILRVQVWDPFLLFTEEKLKIQHGGCSEDMM